MIEYDKTTKNRQRQPAFASYWDLHDTSQTKLHFDITLANWIEIKLDVNITWNSICPHAHKKIHKKFFNLETINYIFPALFAFSIKYKLSIYLYKIIWKNFVNFC